MQVLSGAEELTQSSRFAFEGAEEMHCHVNPMSRSAGELLTLT